MIHLIEMELIINVAKLIKKPLSELIHRAAKFFLGI